MATAKSLEAPPIMYLSNYLVNLPQRQTIFAPDPDNLGRYKPEFQMPDGPGDIELSIRMDYTKGARAILDQIMENKGQLTFGVERREWRCIYCSSPNPIDHRFCSQCGGPRGWIL